MKTRFLLYLLAAWALGAPSLHAQKNGLPHIGYIFPAGMQRGTTCEINVGGQFLGGAKEALVSGSGVKMTVIKYEKPLSQKRANELRDYLKEARKKAMEAKEQLFGMGKFDV